MGTLLGVLATALAPLAVVTLPIGGFPATMATTATFSLIYGGIFDIFKAAYCAVFGKTFSWKQHIIQKGFSYGLSFAFGSFVFKYPNFNPLKFIEKLEEYVSYPLIYGGIKLVRNVVANVLSEYISRFFEKFKKSYKSKKYKTNEIFITNKTRYLQQQTEEIFRNNAFFESLIKDEVCNETLLNEIREKLRKTLNESIIKTLENLFPNLNKNTFLQIKVAIDNKKLDFKDILRKYDEESNSINQDLKSIINQYDSIEDAIKERVQSYIAELKITQTESNIMQQEMEKIEREEYAKQLIDPSLMGNIEQQIEENQKEKVNKNIIDCQNEILQNPFNQSGNSDYLYTSAGIRGIIKVMNLHSKNYSYHDVPLNSDYVSVEEFSEFIKKDVLIVYNIENLDKCC